MWSDKPCHHLMISRRRILCASPNTLGCPPVWFDAASGGGFLSPTFRRKICSLGTWTSNTSRISLRVIVTIRPLYENLRVILNRT